MAIWDECAENIYKEIENEIIKVEKGDRKSIFDNIISTQTSDKKNIAEYEPENVDILGDYTRMHSPGLIRLYSKKIKDTVIRQVPYYTKGLNNEMLYALIKIMCLQVYAHETFHFFIDVLNKIFPFTPSMIEESLATAYEYRLLFCEDISSYKFNRDLVIINNIFSSYQETTVNDMLDISPMYDWDNTQRNGDVFNSMKEFLHRYGDIFEKLNFKNIKLQYYRDWNLYYKHESFLQGLYNYVEDGNLKVLKNNIPNIEYFILGNIKTMFMLSKDEIIV